MTHLHSVTSPLKVLLVALLIAGASGAMSARQGRRPLRFAEAEIFLELNHTDGDLGLHASIDGETWTNLAIEGPGGRGLLNLLTLGRLRAQGLTQLAFESAEPTFEELDPAVFFRRFPEGRYEIEGTTRDGQEIAGAAVLSHVLAAPPSNVTVSGLAAAENCDAVLPVVSAPVLIKWDPVTSSHPEVGKPGPVRIRRYQLFVEREGLRLALDLPPTVTEFEVPTAITDLGKEFKFEIIARTTTNNNTAIESCFTVH